ncbi:AIPR family protein [Parasaccharibacter apium]|uniref:Abortive phage infection protein C-terminal domain-containing protein n=1 Tax=Parasaccharibacter apium TaxID=1510841 RepID=A0ABX4ZMB3_9PROT|nr:AIPR family protein [Parasaccharibacter apium]POS63145.1 hypothetical protein ASQ42_05395 [Parasaccharibacter apium]POS63504.1 hypothetical protein ASO19_04150 [Parasaccharibacter apium]POS64630.1 hypothetical protein ASQ43_05030 [Parasaccharibacter apium]
MPSNKSWETAYAARDDLHKYGDNGLGLFALSLRFGLDDLDTLAADSLVDGPDDKNCDIVHVNLEGKYAILMQCYQAQTAKSAAPAKKAGDLNTALGWLLGEHIDKVPERLRPAANELRTALKNNDIERFHIWYTHNLPESQNVKDELGVVESTARAILNDLYKINDINVDVSEVGKNKIHELYKATSSPILLEEEICLKVCEGYSMSGPSWESFSTAIQASELHRLYKKYTTNMFSANVRDYLGSRRSESNINQGIINTIKRNPEDFWAFNNGLTVLTNNFRIDGNNIVVSGLSIVNGAQTTGAIGSLKEPPSQEAWVQIRFVKNRTGGNTSNIIRDIIKYNNSQNTVEASDFRSTDSIQKRLKEEFKKIPEAEYNGGRRGSGSEVIKRNPNLLRSPTVGQALASFHNKPEVAYHKKTDIWVSDNLYSTFFNDKTSADHIVCAYTLIKSLENYKQNLQNKAKEEELVEADEEVLKYFRERGSIHLLASAVSGCLETILDQKIPNKFRISFGVKTSPKKAEEIWRLILEPTIPFCPNLTDALKGGLRSAESIKEACVTFRRMVNSTRSQNKSTYEEFSSFVHIG